MPGRARTPASRLQLAPARHAASVPTLPNRWQACRRNHPGPCVPAEPCATHGTPAGATRPHAPDAPARESLQALLAPSRAGAIAAGSSGATCGPTAIPMALPGDKATAPRARQTCRPHGTLFHGQQAAAALIVRGLAGLAEGLRPAGPPRGSLRSLPKPVRHGRVAAAAQLKALSRSLLGKGHVPQRQLDAWYAVLSAVKDGPRSAEAPGQRLARSPPWVWTALAPQSPGHQGRSTQAGHGPAWRAAGAGGARAGRHPAVGDRRVQGVPERAAEPWRHLGAACGAPGHRPGAQAALAAPARAALCAGHQNDAAPAPGTRQSPRGRRDV